MPSEKHTPMLLEVLAKEGGRQLMHTLQTLAVHSDTCETPSPNSGPFGFQAVCRQTGPYSVATDGRPELEGHNRKVIVILSEAQRSRKICGCSLSQQMRQQACTILTMSREPYFT